MSSMIAYSWASRAFIISMLWPKIGLFSVFGREYSSKVPQRGIPTDSLSHGLTIYEKYLESSAFIGQNPKGAVFYHGSPWKHIGE
jgi:hypothetical protein